MADWPLPAWTLESTGFPWRVWPEVSVSNPCFLEGRRADGPSHDFPELKCIFEGVTPFPQPPGPEKVNHDSCTPLPGVERVLQVGRAESGRVPSGSWSRRVPAAALESGESSGRGRVGPEPHPGQTSVCCLRFVLKFYLFF